ncbi:uncharacterized protein LOC135127791 [Zophobas morio]|uniref:uncharacterized protein LOC135127791 n=1 Tax=Zophobas morio TaxID=2755281 RepID=UPI0030830BCD
MAAKARKKLYKSVILEIRPRLQSVNVLINLFSGSENVEITLSEDSFQIIADTQTETICCKNLKIVANSLSSVVVTESYVSFRFATVNNLDDWGSFKAELLRTLQSTPKTSTTRAAFLTKSEIYNIQCKNCLQNLSDRVQFERILPLPSENSEPNDWFCHGHCENKVSVLSPKELDVFYTTCYCHLNKKVVGNFVETDKLLVCKRCFSWLGQLKSAEVVKFWFNTVVFKDGDKSHFTSPLDDVFILLEEMLSSVLFNSTKVMLCCQSSTKQKDFILLWVLEKQLRVQICDVGDIKDCKVAKVLFRYESDCSGVVKTWEDDASVASVDVSKPMVVDLLKHLYKFNKIFPKVFSESNNFYISYLMMYE